MTLTRIEASEEKNKALLTIKDDERLIKKWDLVFVTIVLGDKWIEQWLNLDVSIFISLPS